MLQPSISHLSIASIMLNIDQPKVNHNLYLRTVEIIQLVEGPPPPRRITSPRSIASSSSSSDYDSEPSSSSDGDSQSLCSSYCSSDIPLEQLNSDTSHSTAGSDEETFAIRMKRILAWRENFSSPMGTTCSDLSPLTLKRKLVFPDEHGDRDAPSHLSKRSRSDKTSQGGLCPHSCPACDTFFSSRQRLRQHGLDADADDACSVAVQYVFE